MPIDFIAGFMVGAKQAGGMARKAVVGSTIGQGTAGDFYDVNDRIDRLTLLVRAMWSLLEERGLTEEQLRNRMGELDARDGTADEKHRPASVKCPKCQAAVAGGLPSCQFCGHRVGEADPFVGI